MKERLLAGETLRIELWSDPVCGIIFPEMNGVVWTNQTGGTYCCHPELEGLFVPLTFDWEGPDPLYDWAFEEYDADKVGTFLTLHGLFALRPLTEEEVKELPTDGDWRYPLQEAWVPVAVRSDKKFSYPVQLEPFIGRWGVLTYQNSD